MDRDTRKTVVAAAVLMLVFGVGAYFLPVIVIAAGDVSPYAGAAVAVVFVAAFFLVFWLRGRSRRRGGG
jgi:Ca2+/Na+ antiporter